VRRAARATWYMKRVLSTRVTRCMALIAAGLTSYAPARHLHAQAPAPANASSALLAADDADPLELARVVQRFGDAAVLSLLEASQPVATRIAAMRATPWLARPEDALALLAPEVASRDAELAEAAARGLLAIAQRLDGAALERREQSASALGPVVASLDAVAGQTWIRADLRALAATAVAQLQASGAPAPSHE
jgi:hypothetical protein